MCWQVTIAGGFDILISFLFYNLFSSLKGDPVAKSGENIVKAYLEKKGLKVIKIPESSAKTVDFEVYAEKEPVFYLEEKTLELTPPAWKNIDPIYNSIAGHLREAIKQFKSVNPDRKFPNVLSFTNMDPARSIDVLFTTLTGQVITPQGKLRSIDIMKKLESELKLIDLYLWFDEDKLTGHVWEGHNPHYEARLIELLKIE